MNQEQVTTRRGFFHKSIYFLWSVMTAALALPAVAYLLSPFRNREESEWVEAGDVSTLEVNNPKEFVFQRSSPDGWKVTTRKATAWVVKTPEEKIIAFSPRCTHLACAYHWADEDRKFLCPCHDSFFSIEGEVLTGPAPRRLDRYEVRVEGSRLWLGGVVPPDEGSA